MSNHTSRLYTITPSCWVVPSVFTLCCIGALLCTVTLRMLATFAEEACGLEVRECRKLIAVQYHVALSGAKEATAGHATAPCSAPTSRRDEGGNKSPHCSKKSSNSKRSSKTAVQRQSSPPQPQPLLLLVSTCAVRGTNDASCTCHCSRPLWSGFEPRSLSRESKAVEQERGRQNDLL